MSKKVILHTHLEGSLPRSTLSILSKRNNVHFPFDINTVDFRLVIKKNDWNTFRKIFYAICDCFQDETDYYTALFDYGMSIKDSGAIYAEVNFSPWRHISRNINLDTIYKGFERAIIELQENYNLTIRLICDFVRNPNEDVNTILEWLLLNKKDSFLVGIGVSGGTNSLPRSSYQNTCYKLKESGYKITVHAGELEPPSSIIESLDFLYADRIGHGITLTDDLDIFYRIKDRNVHFELCPTANEFIGLGKPNFQSIKEMLSLTNNCSINTDDELIFQTNIEKEFLKLIESNIIHEGDVANLCENAVKHSFLDIKQKVKLYDNIAKNRKF